MSLIRAVGSAEGGNWVALVFDLDDAFESLSKTISSVFSNIYKECIEPLMNCFNQGGKSITDQHSVDPSSRGSTVANATVTRGISGTPVHTIKVKSATAFEYETRKLTDELSNAKRDRENAWSKVNNYDDADYYDTDGKDKKVDECHKALTSKESDFKSKYPVEYEAFKKKLAQEKSEEEKRFQSVSFVYAPSVGPDQGSTAIVHSSSDYDWWGEPKDELEVLIDAGKQYLGFNEKPSAPLENREVQQVSDSENEDWW
ncbi:MAG: hypothetical protein KF898_04990 [Parachlamydiales bacterium]|nr:hypothetical protein [Candidatus Acheromyda pituitae]